MQTQTRRAVEDVQTPEQANPFQPLHNAQPDFFLEVVQVERVGEPDRYSEEGVTFFCAIFGVLRTSYERSEGLDSMQGWRDDEDGSRISQRLTEELPVRFPPIRRGIGAGELLKLNRRAEDGLEAGLESGVGGVAFVGPCRGQDRQGLVHGGEVVVHEVLDIKGRQRARRGADIVPVRWIIPSGIVVAGRVVVDGLISTGDSSAARCVRSVAGRVVSYDFARRQFHF